MSEEEIIKKLKSYTETAIPCDSCRYCIERPNIYYAIQGLLDLYNKEKEKNNNLIHELRIYQNETISKNKIRELLTKLEISDDLEAQIAIPYIREILEDNNHIPHID